MITGRIPSRITTRELMMLPEAEPSAMKANHSGKLAARSKRCSKIPCIEDKVANKAAMVSVCARIEITTMRWVNSSLVAASKMPKSSGRRSAFDKVSGWRSPNHRMITAANRI
ncbi:MAG: hypothetical protein ACD_54C00867G0001 [uncultured bacterium]|nr:MAG: hypothetical protein ACD_54C00867G0001 [uncultured bacterium]